MTIPKRIETMLCIHGYELRVGPKKKFPGTELDQWEATIYSHSSGYWVWVEGGYGDNPDEAVENLLKENAENIEKTCKDLEKDGYELI